ncbi:MAG TPA: hypothetical protein VJ183_01180 [Chloroflexia bacterium]|nr:hypothetical protein [Chloroflexia bacterium]
MINTHRRTRNIIVVLVLFIALLGTVVAPGTTRAARGGCRGDPVMVLNDGTVIDILTDIGTEVWNVQRIEYIVHAPVGSRLVTTAYTNGLLGIVERMTFLADAPGNRYTVDVVIYTATRNINVRATTTVVRLLGLDRESASGMDRQHLIMQLAP